MKGELISTWDVSAEPPYEVPYFRNPKTRLEPLTEKKICLADGSGAPPRRN
jgi:hypothetical protein